jgi:hypothetical protein
MIKTILVYVKDLEKDSYSYKMIKEFISRILKKIHTAI